MTTPNDVAKIRPQTQCQFCLFSNWNYGDVYNFDGIYFWCDINCTGVNQPLWKNEPKCPKHDECCTATI